MKISVEQYVLLCDVVERAWHHDPVQPRPNELFNTSSYAREAANRINDELGLEIEVPR